MAAIASYARAAAERGSQVSLLTGDYKSLWATASSFYSFGRLATFSYLEYVFISGYGADCADLMFGDPRGSKSHRNGMLLLTGADEIVWDKRAQNGFSGVYEDLPGLAGLLSDHADSFLDRYEMDNPHVDGISMFTLESNLCTFKNHFYGRRYPGVYADMALDRILWAEEHQQEAVARVFRDIRESRLPRWLREECDPSGLTIRQKAAQFAMTGYPYRGQHFLRTNA